ncbi:MAG: hypothetical protein RJA70_3782 [Pseudomonadota bacterium]|jgi:CheY-like chemotaxis protein
MAAILIVEDEPFLREIAEELIQEWGHQILSASDVAEALSHVRSSASIDLIFTDVCLKHEVNGGFELARQAVIARPAVRVLYATGNLMSDALRLLFVDNAQYIQKPYSASQLRGSIDNLLAR